MNAMTEERTYIEIQQAANDLGIDRTTLYYNLKRLKIKPKKFPLDRKSYLSRENFNKVKQARDAAKESRH